MITIILGMHRSGTSTIAGVLHLNNISLGTYKNFWPRPLAQNPKGFYENYDFRKLNDLLLKKVNYNVKSLNPVIPNSIHSEKLFKKMKTLILQSNKYFNDWGWKDPRTCLTINIWNDVFNELEIMNDLKIIFVSRKAISVARSLNKRDGLPINEGVELWKTYTERALNYSLKSNFNVFYCTFEQLLKEPIPTCEKIFSFLDRDFDSAVIDKFIDKSISTSGAGIDFEQSKEITSLEKKIDSLIS